LKNKPDSQIREIIFLKKLKKQTSTQLKYEYQQKQQFTREALMGMRHSKPQKIEIDFSDEAITAIQCPPATTS